MTLIDIDDLKLRRRGQNDDTVVVGPVVIAPTIDEDYWEYRVDLTENQAVLGFPKFGTIGVGFAKEDDWNTNLPYSSGLEMIADHISHNRLAGGDDEIPRAHVIRAITMIRDAAGADPKFGPKCLACVSKLRTQRDLNYDHWVEDCENVELVEGRFNLFGSTYERDEDGWPIKESDDDADS